MIFNFEKKAKQGITSCDEEFESWQENELMMVDCHTYQLWQLADPSKAAAESANSVQGIIFFNNHAAVGEIQTRSSLSIDEEDNDSTLVNCVGGFAIGENEK